MLSLLLLLFLDGSRRCCLLSLPLGSSVGSRLCGGGGLLLSHGSRCCLLSLLLDGSLRGGGVLLLLGSNRCLLGLLGCSCLGSSGILLLAGCRCGCYRLLLSSSGVLLLLSRGSCGRRLLSLLLFNSGSGSGSRRLLCLLCGRLGGCLRLVLCVNEATYHELHPQQGEEGALPAVREPGPAAAIRLAQRRCRAKTRRNLPPPPHPGLACGS